MSELLEKILSKNNMNTAYKRVCANKGAGGVDEVTVEELGDYIKENWESIRNQIRNREYKPQPVRRVEIPKPNGGMRKLGIPTVMDRVIQQGIVQVISPMCEPLFSVIVNKKVPKISEKIPHLFFVGTPPISVTFPSLLLNYTIALLLHCQHSCRVFWVNCLSLAFPGVWWK
ncbi:hypothetical protein [Claveliimonas bilis]|uniref:hypothetical protein n=1 Tax=Claveliimonas bilis TaxID=3028070 RepID=UPI002F40C128